MRKIQADKPFHIELIRWNEMRAERRSNYATNAHEKCIQ